MSYDLVREKILLNRSIGRETTQVMLEGDIIVPDVKPDMAVILQTDAKACIERAEGLSDRVNFIGKMELHVLYIAKGHEKPVHSMSVTANFDDFMNMAGVTKDTWVTAKADIVHIEFKMLNDRKLSYRAVIGVTLSAECSESHDVVTDIKDIPENQLLKNSLNINKTIENKADRFSVRDQIIVPTGKPNIMELLSCNVSIANKDVRVMSGRLNVTGELSVHTLYKGENEDSLIEFIESEVPFSGTLDVNGAKDDMFADVQLVVQNKQVQVLPDADGEDRVIEVDVSVLANINVYSSETMEILEDAYCINYNLNIEKTSVCYPRLVCRNRNQAPVKEVIQVGQECPDIMQIFMVTGKPMLDSVKVMDDKIAVEGAIETNILYVAQSDDMPLYSYKQSIPYHQIIETKSARPDMHVTIDINVDHSAFNMLSERETEVRFLMTFNTQVTEERCMEVIGNIEFSEIDKSVLENLPSMALYVVQKQDSLWDIAKHYNTSIDEILAVNDMDNTGKVMPGQKLLILKKVIS